MQKIVETKKVMIPHTSLTPLTRLWLQTPTQYQRKLMIIKLLMIPLGHILDMVRLNLEFVEDYPRTRSFQRVGILFCVWMLEGYKSVHTCITTSYTTKRNRVGQLQGHTNSTYFSVIFCKWSVEVCTERGSYFMIIQQRRWKTTLLWTLLLIGLVMRVLESLVQM